MPRIAVKPDLLRWARERVGRSVEELSGRFKKLAEWERGEAQPTFKQLEAFAGATYVPFGYFFLPEPPEDWVRAMGERAFVLEAHHTTHIEGTQLTLDQAMSYCDELRQRAVTSCDGRLRQRIATYCDMDRDTPCDNTPAEVYAGIVRFEEAA